MVPELEGLQGDLAQAEGSDARWCERRRRVEPSLAGNRRYSIGIRRIS